jgi:uncharacterized membrane protein
MENIKTQIHQIASNTNNLIQQHSKIVRLEIYERITNLIASGISSGIIILFGVFSFLFINVGLAFYLSEVFNSSIKGFLCVGIIYALVLVIYLILRKHVARNRVKNAILIKLSKDIDNFDELLAMQAKLYSDIEKTKEELKTGFEELKNSFTMPEQEEEKEEHKGGDVPRMAITSAVNFLLQKIVFRNSGFIKHTVVPIIANALITSKVFKETKTTSLIENLKLKFLGKLF